MLFVSGAAIFYNYIDPVLHNSTQDGFQLVFNVAGHQLEGELLRSVPHTVKDHIYQKSHRLIRRHQRPAIDSTTVTEGTLIIKWVIFS